MDDAQLNGESWWFIVTMDTNDGTIDDDAKGGVFVRRRWLKNKIQVTGNRGD